MYTTSDFRRGLRIELEGQPYSIVEFEHHKPGKGASIVRTRLRHLITGQVIDPTFRSGDKVGRPDVEDKEAQYLYANGDSFNFMDPISYEQYEMNRNQLGDAPNFLIENLMVSVLFYDGRPVTIELPNHVVLEVADTDPAIRGDTVTGATKIARMHTGHTCNVPLFVSIGDKLKVDTRTGDYIERA